MAFAGFFFDGMKLPSSPGFRGYWQTFCGDIAAKKIDPSTNTWKNCDRSQLPSKTGELRKAAKAVGEGAFAEVV